MTPLRALLFAFLVAAVAATESRLSDLGKLTWNAVFYPGEADFRMEAVADEAFDADVQRRSLQDVPDVSACLAAPFDATVTCSATNCPNATDRVQLEQPDFANVSGCGDLHKEFCDEGGALTSFYAFCPPCKAEFENYASCIFDTAFAGQCPPGLANCDVTYDASTAYQSRLGMMVTFIGSMAVSLWTIM